MQKKRMHEMSCTSQPWFSWVDTTNSRGSHGLMHNSFYLCFSFVRQALTWPQFCRVGDTGAEKLRGLPKIFIYSFVLQGKHEVFIFKLVIECWNMLFWPKNILIILIDHLTIEISETWYWRFINSMLSLWCLWAAVSSLDVNVSSTRTCRLCGW